MYVDKVGKRNYLVLLRLGLQKIKASKYYPERDTVILVTPPGQGPTATMWSMCRF